MKIKLLLFGVLSDILGEHEMSFALDEEVTVKKFKANLLQTYPELDRYGFSIAVNEVYSSPDFILQDGHVVALIPPVSGG